MTVRDLPTPPVGNPTVWKNRIVESGFENPEQLLAHPANWRVHPKHQQDALEAVLDEVGYVDRVLVNRTTGFVVDGHLRVAVGISRGETAIPVDYLDLTEQEEALILATFDAITGMATADKDKLKALLDIAKPQSDAARDVLEKVAAKGGVRRMEGETSAGGEVSLQRIAELRAKWGTELGQLWTLTSADGKRAHRIICGDSTDADTVKRLLNKFPKPNLCVTDPPYGVEYDASWRQEALDDQQRYALGEVQNDDIIDWSPAYKLFPGDVLYVWHAGAYADIVGTSIRACGFTIRAQCIWVKQTPIISRGHYHWQHEPVYYAVRDGGTGDWQGSRKETTVWQIDSLNPAGRNANEPTEDTPTGHSTQKPVECMRRPIVNHTKVGDAVYEPFSGSGTTIHAAESCGRICAAVELDPGYVALALERLSALGCTAKLSAK